jgi:hypothetical protein
MLSLLPPCDAQRPESVELDAIAGPLQSAQIFLNAARRTRRPHHSSIAIASDADIREEYNTTPAAVRSSSPPPLPPLPPSLPLSFAAEIRNLFEDISKACDHRFSDFQDWKSDLVVRCCLMATRDSLAAAQGALPHSQLCTCNQDVSKVRVMQLRLPPAYYLRICRESRPP